MDERIKQELEREEATPFHEELLNRCIRLVDMSRSKMQENYDAWDRYDEIYRGYMAPDAQDQKASDRKEPTKMVVPLTYSQVQTFVAFCMSLFYQRPRVFELIGMGAEDHVPAKIGEALLDRDLTHNTFDAKCDQFLTDIGRFGLGVLKNGWVVEHQKELVQRESPGLSFFGLQLGQPSITEVMEDVVKYAGNKINNISPYRFFPDVRLPLSRFQEGEFCASEDEIGYQTLRQMEYDGQVAGIKYVKPLSVAALTDSKRNRKLVHTTVTEKMQATHGDMPPSGTVIVTECQMKLIPADMKVADGQPLGTSTVPEIWNVWYANDQRVIKAEPLGYVHNQFTYSLAEYSPDQHNVVNAGLSEIIDQLQGVVTWLINSHITSVRKTIQNWIVVDPKGVELDDLRNRSPVIRLKGAAGMQGVDRWVKQLNVNDVTQGHVQDAEYLHKLVQVVTGINENALGQFHTGRRSATEARAVNLSAATRLKKTAQLIWKTALVPLAKQMLSNLREGLDVDTYVRVIGDNADPTQYISFKKVNRQDLVGDYDFQVFDGTLPTERLAQAAALKELLVALMSNPEAIPMLGYDPKALLREVLELEGIKHPERFMLSMESMMQLAMMSGAANGQQGTPGAAGGEGATGAASPVGGPVGASVLPFLGGQGGTAG